MSGWPFVGMTSTFSSPMRRMSLATNSAARRTSSLCCGKVLTLGMRSRSFSSPRKRCWFWLAYATAEDAIEISRLECQNIRVYRAGAGLLDTGLSLSCMPLKNQIEFIYPFLDIVTITGFPPHFENACNVFDLTVRLALLCPVEFRNDEILYSAYLNCNPRNFARDSASECFLAECPGFSHNEVNLPDH